MKKLSVLLLVIMQPALLCEVRQGLSDIARGASNIIEGAAEAVSAPFYSDEAEDIEYREDIDAAKEKRNKARKDIAENGSRGWFGQKKDPEVEYKKDVRKAEKKREKARLKREKQEAREAKNARA